MPNELFGADAFSPREVAERIETVGVAKARLPLRAMFALSVLAGAFIGLGALASLLVGADATLPPAVGRWGAGVVFSLGLLLVVVAGAELFTGNNLLVMAWADGKLSGREVLRNWVVVCTGNLAGAVGLAVLASLAATPLLLQGHLGETAIRVAVAKAELPLPQAFFRGALCNVLVCLAVWMAAAGRSVIDKAVAIVPPVATFVALGFEHSIANFFFFPFAWITHAWAPEPGLLPSVEALEATAVVMRLGVVIAGNLLGGSVLVALMYWLIYRAPTRAP